MTKIVGLNGKIGSGKTAAAKALHEIAGKDRASHVEFSDTVMSLADSWMQRIGLVEVVGPKEIKVLRDTVAEKYRIQVDENQAGNLDGSSLAPYLAERRAFTHSELAVRLPNKEKHRPLLQWLGCQMITHVDAQFWSRTVEAVVCAERGPGKEVVTISGVRHPADAHMVHGLRGYVVEIVRPGEYHELQNHSSEGGLPAELIDARILNDSNLTALHDKMAQFWDSL